MIRSRKNRKRGLASNDWNKKWVFSNREKHAEGTPREIGRVFEREKNEISGKISIYMYVPGSGNWIYVL